MKKFILFLGIVLFIQCNAIILDPFDGNYINASQTIHMEFSNGQFHGSIYNKVFKGHYLIQDNEIIFNTMYTENYEFTSLLNTVYRYEIHSNKLILYGDYYLELFKSIE